MSKQAWMVLFGEAGVPCEVARKHAKKFHKHGMKITFVPDLKNRLRDWLSDLKAEQVEDAQSKSTRNSVYKVFFQNTLSEPLFFSQKTVLETLRKPLVIWTF